MGTRNVRLGTNLALSHLHKERLRTTAKDSTLPFEFHVLEAMLTKMVCLSTQRQDLGDHLSSLPSQFTVLDSRLQELSPALTEVLNSLLDPQLFSVDRGQLHILLHHSKSLSEFDSLVKDIETTLSETLDQEEDMAEMYLTHWSATG